MKLTLLPDTKLRTKSEKVNLPLTKEKIELIKNMIIHIDDSMKPGSTDRPGVGLAAVQVGHLDRMFYINAPVSEDDSSEWREFLINPKIISRKGGGAALEDGEGCLSVGDEIPLQKGLVHRDFEVTVEGYSYFQKKVVRITKRGYHAIIIQHEQDHLNGRLFVDRINQFDKWAKVKNEILI